MAPAFLALLLAPAPAAAQDLIPLNPDEAAKLGEAMRRSAYGCGGAGDGIIVCARSLAGHGQRMEFPREPGEIVRHINEPGSGVDALAAERCTRLCNVGVSVNLLQAAEAVPKIVRHVLGKD